MVFVVKVPVINGLRKTEGCQKAGNAVLKCLREEVHSNEQGKAVEFAKLDLEEIHVDNNDVELSNELIYKNGFETFETHCSVYNLKGARTCKAGPKLRNEGAKPRVIFLGGDHSGSYSLTRAFFDFCQNQGKEPCLIVFDAHADCMKPMKEPTHEEWLRKLIEDGFPVENILLVGVRNMWKDELDFIKEKGIKIITIDQLNNDLEDSCDTIMEFSSGKELYVSVDIDVVDPAFAPATGYQEPGGLSSRQMIYLMKRINKIRNLRAVDIVEINPDKKGAEETIKLAAKVLAELL